MTERYTITIKVMRQSLDAFLKAICAVNIRPHGEGDSIVFYNIERDKGV